jgi:alpha-galactosidase
LYETFPEIKAFGCCHEVFGTQKVLKGIYEKETGEKIADWHDVEVNVVGINHFTWFTEASYKGVNLFPVYRNYIEKHFQDGYTLEEENWLNANFRCKHRVKMDLFKRYGWIAAAGDRHLVEFMPGNEYLKDPETVQSWDYSLTTVQWRKEDLKERLERSDRLAEGKETIRLEPTGEEGILLIKALCGLQRFISNVNIPNYASQIPNLPKDAIVETNAVFSKDHIRPVYAGPLKDDVLQLIKPHIENHALTYRAAIQCDKALVMQAFQNDPNVKGHHPSSEEIHELVEDMIQNTLTYLPEGWKNY